jgi:hypothetical protein
MKTWVMLVLVCLAAGRPAYNQTKVEKRLLKSAVVLKTMLNTGQTDLLYQVEC